MILLRDEIFRAVLLIALASSQCRSQSTGPARTTGPCSPAITGSGNTINIKACGIQQAEEFKKLLTDIATHQQEDTSTILKKLDKCLKGVADRHLAESQKSTLLSALAPFSGQKISVICILGDTEGKAFASDFVKILRQAKWSGIDKGSGLVEIGGAEEDPVGVILNVNHADVLNNSVPPGASPLLQAITDFGLNPKAANRDDVPPGTIRLTIGRKPPSPQ